MEDLGIGLPTLNDPVEKISPRHAVLLEAKLIPYLKLTTKINYHKYIVIDLCNCRY